MESLDIAAEVRAVNAGRAFATGLGAYATQPLVQAFEPGPAQGPAQAGAGLEAGVIRVVPLEQSPGVRRDDCRRAEMAVAGVAVVLAGVVRGTATDVRRRSRLPRCGDLAWWGNTGPA